MEQMIQAILDGDHLEVWSVTICKLSFWLGLLFVILGIIKMTQVQRYQGRQSQMMSSGVLSYFAGFFLLSFKAFIESLTETIFNVTSTNDFNFSGPSVDITNSFTVTTPGPETIYIEFAVYVIQIVGLLAIVRGVILFRSANKDSQNAFGAAWHLVGGIVALNFVTFTKVIGNSGGTEVQSVITRIFG